MGHIAGIVLIILGALLLYSILNKSSKTEGAKNGLILAAIMIVIGGWSIYDENQKQERKAKLEQERIENMRKRIKCEICDGAGCKWCHYTGYINQTSFGKSNLTCGSTGCECTIKRNELEAGGLIRCSCGHLTSWHHN